MILYLYTQLYCSRQTITGPLNSFFHLFCIYFRSQQGYKVVPAWPNYLGRTVVAFVYVGLSLALKNLTVA